MDFPVLYGLDSCSWPAEIKIFVLFPVSPNRDEDKDVIGNVLDRNL